MNPPARDMPSRGYLICCLQRTGSTLLAKALTRTGVAGCPLEYFNPWEQQSSWMRKILGNSTVVDGLPRILNAGTSSNGLFGAKVQWNHFRYVGMSINGEWRDCERVAPYKHLVSQSRKLISLAAAHESLRSRFPDFRAETAALALLQASVPDLRVIWLRRQNMVARAISHVRALQTGLWFRTSSEPAASQPVESGRDNFDLARIHMFHCVGSFEEESCRRFLHEQKVSPHCVLYEDLVSDYETTIRRVLDFLDLESEETNIPPPFFLKLSDATSDEWEHRYRAHIAEAGL